MSGNLKVVALGMLLVRVANVVDPHYTVVAKFPKGAPQAIDV